MIVGIPKEVKDNEYRIAATPEGVRELVDAGQTVLIEEGAGLGSSLSEERYKRSGAQFVSSAEDVWRGSDMILKVKEPIASEYALMREGQILFTYLHLAANPRAHPRADPTEGRRRRLRDRPAARRTPPAARADE